jgi:hypothetical protein
MTKLRWLAALAGAFLAGVAFVIACGNGDPKIIDASTADAAECGQCEPSIGADRIYQVISSDGGNVGQVVTASATCEEGDVLLGGGCYVIRQGATTPYDTLSTEVPLVVNGPRPPLGQIDPVGRPTTYECVYAQPGDAGVFATAICFKPLPPQ